jgi:hypothetical protein
LRGFGLSTHMQATRSFLVVGCSVLSWAVTGLLLLGLCIMWLLFLFLRSCGFSFWDLLLSSFAEKKDTLIATTEKCHMANIRFVPAYKVTHLLQLKFS